MSAQQEKQSLTEYLSQWGSDVATNVTTSFTRISAKEWIRIIIIVGTYLLIRPHLLKLGGKAQTRAHEADAADGAAGAAEVHPNELRTGKKPAAKKIAIPGVDSDEEGEGQEEQPAEWGKKARVRQRKFIRSAMEEAERRLAEQQEAESDKEIEEFLVE
jgi:hypothetical protein